MDVWFRNALENRGLRRDPPGEVYPALAVTLALALARGVSAQESSPPDLLRAWLVAPPRPETAALLDQIEPAYGHLDAVDRAVAGVATARPILRPGFHHYQVAGFDPPFHAVAVIPRASPPPAGHPLVLAPAPAPFHPPDEVILRGRYGAFLELGWVVLSHLQPHFQVNGAYVPKRDLWFDGPDLANTLIADFALRHPIDRDRVLLLSRPMDTNPAGTDKVPFFGGDTTSLGGYHYALPGTHIPDAFPDTAWWRGRLIAVHLSTHNHDEAVLFAKRIAELSSGGGLRTWSLRDRHLDWTPRIELRRDPLAEVCARTRRDPMPSALDVPLGGKLPSGFEWIEAHDLQAPLRVMVQREGTAVRITTPGEPERPILAIDLYLPDAPRSLAVTLNGRPVHGGPIPHGVREALLAARHRWLSGRPCERVLRLRP